MANKVKRMKACKHYQRGGETWITCSGGHPWNAWVEVYSPSGRLILSSFETGLRATYLEHLVKNPECRQFVKISKRIIQEELKEIEAEWKLYSD